MYYSFNSMQNVIECLLIKLLLFSIQTIYPSIILDLRGGYLHKADIGENA